jgi:hypothetical protein
MTSNYHLVWKNGSVLHTVVLFVPFTCHKYFSTFLDQDTRLLMSNLVGNSSLLLPSIFSTIIVPIASLSHLDVGEAIGVLIQSLFFLFLCPVDQCLDLLCQYQSNPCPTLVLPQFCDV